jgi:hypothetical protein
VKVILQAVAEPYWDNKTVYIIGGGPSLKGFDFSKLTGLTIGVNDSAFKAKTQVLFSLDKVWMHKRVKEIRQFEGEKYLAVAPGYSPQKHFDVPGAVYLNRRRGPGMSSDPRDIWSSNSGFGALNLCFLKKARTIVMMGLDMCVDDTSSHWHGGYDWQRKPNNSIYSGWISDFDVAAKQFANTGTRVYNAINGSKKSLITSFPTVELESLMDL